MKVDDLKLIVLISKIAKLTNIDMNSIKLEDNNTFH